jgi:molybdenum cofactor synthesis domain-containing protein
MSKNYIEVKSVNISKEKGTVKTPVDKIELSEIGVEGDAHSGAWHRQVSLLGLESFNRFSEEANRKIEFGEFAENITTDGLSLYLTSPLDRFFGDDVELEVTQIGKKCHGDSCAIYTEVGNCVMPKEGIFCRVIKGGKLKAGDKLIYKPYIFKTLIITLSDRASKGVYKDRSGAKIKSMMENWLLFTHKHFEIENQIIPDDAEKLEAIIEAAKDKFDFIICTGGTGIGSRDITVDVVEKLIDKQIPGIMEHIRYKYGSIKPNALLSRGIAGIIGKAQIYTLPGSEKAVTEYMTEILKTTQHIILMMNDIDSH